MGRLLDWLGLGVTSVTRYADALPQRVASPLAPASHLSPAVVYNDLFNQGDLVVTRAEAMSIPAVARGRNLIAPVLARQQLVAYRQGVPLPNQPTWLSSSRYFPPRLRALWTLDDLIFSGLSLWVVDRGLPDESGRRLILDAMRLPPANWTQRDGLIVVTGADGSERELVEDEYILFPAPSEGLLTMAARTIRGALRLEERWLERIENPIPVVEIRYTGDDDLEESEMTDIRDGYLKARLDSKGVVMVTPRGFEVHPHGDDAAELFVEGRNAVALDVARFLSLPSTMIDASQVNGSSVDYENNAIGRSAYYDLSLRTWALPFEEALSQDDVVAHGQNVAFDFANLTLNPDTGAPVPLED
jgi:Phage portal protein